MREHELDLTHVLALNSLLTQLPYEVQEAVDPFFLR